MLAVCQKCGVKHDGVWGTIRPVCVQCYAKSKGVEYKGIKNQSEIDASYRRTGRPTGTTDYETAKINDTHRMTPKAHEFITQNKRLIEKMAREHYEIQWKML